MAKRGRKPQGEFYSLSKVFTVRMTPELRAQLDRARGKRSAGQELLRRLQDSFQRDKDRSRNRDLRALNFLIAEAAEAIGREWWRSNPFHFEAFKLTVDKLLEAIRPPGKIKSPLLRQRPRRPKGLLGRAFSSPAAYSDHVTAQIMAALSRNRPLTQEFAEIAREFPDIAEQWDVQFAGMSHVKHDLNLKLGRK
jgi:hypothetical protein